MSTPIRHSEAFPPVPEASRHEVEHAWVSAIAAGDAAAFEAMFSSYAEALCGFIYGYVQSQDEAEELVHDLFFWIWDHRHEWEVSGSLRMYLFKAARNRALSRLRHRTIERRFQQTMGTEDAALAPRSSQADHEVCCEELAAAIERAIAALPERCRQVFELNRRQHLSYAEIAAILKISVRTVEVHMGRALVALRKSLANWR